MLISNVENKLVILVPGKLYQITDGEMIAWPHNGIKSIHVNKNDILYFIKDGFLANPNKLFVFLINGKLYTIYDSNVRLRTFKELI